jgi:hypothetical protein
MAVTMLMPKKKGLFEVVLLDVCESKESFVVLGAGVTVVEGL